MSHATPKDVIEFPSNIVKFVSQSLIDCENKLVNFSFSPNSRLLDLGRGSFKEFKKLFSVDLSNCKLLQTIPRECFQGSTLRIITFPEDGSLKSLDSGSFASTQIFKIKLPKTVQNIGGHIWGTPDVAASFESCLFLTMFEIPSDSELNNIGYNSFGISKIIEIFVPKNTILQVGSLGNIATLQRIILHENNTNYNLYKGILYTSDYSTLIACPCNYSNKIEIHPNCTTLEVNAFRAATTFYDIVIPSSVKILKSQIFYAFSNNGKIIFEPGLENLNFSNIFVYTSSEVILPSTLKWIGSRTFNEYYGKSIEFFSNIECIDSETFLNCYNLEYIKFNEFRSSSCIIKSNAFKNCPKLKYIILPLRTAPVFRFEPNAFNQCSRLQQIKYNLNMQDFKHHFNSGIFNNKTQVSIISPSNSSCGDVHISFPSSNTCKIVQFCTSHESYSLYKSILTISPFISM